MNGERPCLHVTAVDGGYEFLSVDEADDVLAGIAKHNKPVRISLVGWKATVSCGIDSLGVTGVPGGAGWVARYSDNKRQNQIVFRAHDVTMIVDTLGEVLVEVTKVPMQHEG